MKYAKPQEEIFLHAQKVANARPENILFVGDNPKLDIEPAVLLAWNTILINHFEPTSLKGINDFRQILDVIF